jgi:hypothetical protein
MIVNGSHGGSLQKYKNMISQLSIKELYSMEIDWQKTTEPYIFSTMVNGQQVRLRLNSFPDEPMCTVIWSDGVEQDLDDLGADWTLPKQRGVS